MHNPNITTNADATAIVDVAIEVADKMIEKLYFVKEEE